MNSGKLQEGGVNEGKVLEGSGIRLILRSK